MRIACGCRAPSSGSPAVTLTLSTNCGPPSGTTVREYVSSNGTVFAVAWQGPWLPDLRQMLGPYFDDYQRALQSTTGKRRARGSAHGRAARSHRADDRPSEGVFRPGLRAASHAAARAGRDDPVSQRPRSDGASQLLLFAFARGPGDHAAVRRHASASTPAPAEQRAGDRRERRADQQLFQRRLHQRHDLRARASRRAARRSTACSSTPARAACACSRAR